jgi:hypothetical protein
MPRARAPPADTAVAQRAQVAEHGAGVKMLLNSLLTLSVNKRAEAVKDALKKADILPADYGYPGKDPAAWIKAAVDRCSAPDGVWTKQAE